MDFIFKETIMNELQDSLLVIFNQCMFVSFPKVNALVSWLAISANIVNKNKGI